MSTLSFLIALAALSIGTYAMRFAGVKLGAAIATKGRRRAPATASADPATASSNPATGSADPANPDAPTQASTQTQAVDHGQAGDQTTTVTKWMDRATVVLIAAVCATTAVFDGQDIADPARLIGVGAGVLAAVVRVPMLACVLIGMGICAVIRMTGIL